MQRQVIMIHPSAPPKPPEGASCNGCGVCCATEPCPVGVWISRRRHGACEALLWNEAEGRYRCGVVVDPQRHLGLPRFVSRAWGSRLGRWLGRRRGQLLARWALRMISAGSGCDCSLEVERPAATSRSPGTGSKDEALG